jgi:hypothetical protein
LKIPPPVFTDPDRDRDRDADLTCDRDRDRDADLTRDPDRDPDRVRDALISPVFSSVAPSNPL